jgi:diaminopimelate decarboxylase
LHAEGVPLPAIAEEVGTPTYVYLQSSLLARIDAFLSAAPAGSLVCFAVKANNNPHILRLLAAAGLGADVTSGGELFLALHAGFPADRIIFSGVGKTETELAAALEFGIRAIHIESEQELRLLGRLAEAHQKPVDVGVRLNPDVAVSTHAHISTGGRQHKFGVDQDTALGMLLWAREHQWLRPVGIAVHIGSQVTTLEPYRRALERAMALASQFTAHGGKLEHLDAGGGLGVSYQGEQVPEPGEWMRAVAGQVAGMGLRLVVEPGRAICAPAGLVLTRVLYVKEQLDKRFAVVDAGMNVLLRPALYGARHPILPVAQPKVVREELYDVVGPICETGDTLATGYSLPRLASGDLLAIEQAGAYGFAMSSNYNGQLRPAEVIVSGDNWRLIRRRENYDALLRDT